MTLSHHYVFRMPAQTLAEMLETVPALMDLCCARFTPNNPTLKALRLVDKMTRKAAVAGIKWCAFKFSTEQPSFNPLLNVVQGAQLSNLYVEVINCDGDGAGEFGLLDVRVGGSLDACEAALNIATCVPFPHRSRFGAGESAACWEGCFQARHLPLRCFAITRQWDCDAADRAF